MEHIPVLQGASLDILDPKPGEIVIDVTLGLGGHAKSFLEKVGSKGRVIGIDADEKNLQEAEGMDIECVHANFRELASLDLPSCDILFADLGLSSPHLDDPGRGFSFRAEGPLDCRFDQSQGQSAADFLQRSLEEELIQTFKEYGEIRQSKKLTEAIKESLKEKEIGTTQDLVAIVESVFDWKAKQVLPQVFQAIRIAVNDEMGALETLLEEGPKLLKSGGRIGIISYHSLEDRPVKQTFRALTEAEKDPVTGADLDPAPYELLTKKAIKAESTEVEANPRARSARFRAIRKL